MAGEILHPTMAEGLPASIRSPSKLVNHIRRSIGVLPTPVGGAKIHLEHLEQRQAGIELLRTAFPDAKVIVLYRDRIAEQFISWKLARLGGPWIGAKPSDGVQRTIRVDVDDFRAFSTRHAARYRLVLSDHWVRERMLLIQYEEMCKSVDEFFERQVCPFFGVPFRSVKTTLTKQNTRPLHEVVENYDEVADLIESASLTVDPRNWTSG